MPTVSVVIPTYNHGHLLGRAICSVLNQTFSDFEIIIVDDGSTDNTRLVVERFISDHRVMYLFQPNKGLAAARNLGIRYSKGEYIGFLDADDWWLPLKLERQIEIFRLNQLFQVTYTSYRLAGDCDSELLDNEGSQPDRMSLHEALLYRNIITGSASSVLINSKCFHQVGFFDESLPCCEDQDMWRRLASHFKFCRVNEVLVVIERSANGLQMDVDKMVLGKMRYLKKLQRDIPNELAFHLPKVTYLTYQWIAWRYLRQLRLAKSCYFIMKLALAKPVNIISFIKFLFGKFRSYSRKNVSHPYTNKMFS